MERTKTNSYKEQEDDGSYAVGRRQRAGKAATLGSLTEPFQRFHGVKKQQKRKKERLAPSGPQTTGFGVRAASSERTTKILVKPKSSPPKRGNAYKKERFHWCFGAFPINIEAKILAAWGSSWKVAQRQGRVVFCYWRKRSVDRALKFISSLLCCANYRADDEELRGAGARALRLRGCYRFGAL